MPREALPIGEVGKITTTELPGGGWRARGRVRCNDGRTRQVEATAPTKAKATRRLRDRAAAKANDTGDGLRASSRVSELVVEWWAGEGRRVVAGKLRPQTLEGYRRYRDRIDDGIGALTLREATPRRLGAFVAESASGSTAVAKHLRMHLRAMFALAVRLDALPTNPAAALESVTLTKPAPRALSVDELAVLRRRIHMYEDDGTPEGRRGAGRAAGGRPRARFLADVFDLQIGTGARIGEVLALRWEDVDLAATAPTVTIAGTVVRLDGTKAAGGGLIRQEVPKTADGHRRIAVPAFVVEVLMHRRVEASASAEGFVFSTSRGTPLDPHNVRTKLRAARGEAFEWVTPHVLRKTVATLVEREAGVRDSSLLLGHADTGVTSRHYVERLHEAPDVTAILDRLAPDSVGREI